MFKTAIRKNRCAYCGSDILPNNKYFETTAKYQSEKRFPIKHKYHLDCCEIVKKMAKDDYEKYFYPSRLKEKQEKDELEKLKPELWLRAKHKKDDWIWYVRHISHRDLPKGQKTYAGIYKASTFQIKDINYSKQCGIGYIGLLNFCWEGQVCTEEQAREEAKARNEQAEKDSWLCGG